LYIVESVITHLPPFYTYVFNHRFWATVCKTVSPVLSFHCLSVCLSYPVCLSVCDVGVSWPNGWMNQDETWRAGRPRRWPHCVRWEPSTPSPKGQSPQFLAHFIVAKRLKCIKMPLGMEVGLIPGDFVLDGDPAPSPKRGGASAIFGPRLLWPIGCVDQDATWYGGRPWPMRHCVRWGPSFTSPKGAQPPIFGQVRCGQTPGWTKMPLGMEVGLGPGDFVFDGDLATARKKGHTHPHPIFGPCLLWPNGWMNEDRHLVWK